MSSVKFNHYSNLKCATKLLKDGWWIELSIEPNSGLVLATVKNADDETSQQASGRTITTALRALGEKR